MKKVAILRKFLLPISETFVKEQFLALKEWDGTLIGKYKISDGIKLDDIRHILYENKTEIKNKILTENERDPDLIKILNYLKPNLIHIHFSVQAVENWESIKDLNIPVIITLHGYDITIYKNHWRNQDNKFLQSYPEKLLSIAKKPNVHFIAVSEAIKQRAIEYGIDENKLTVKYIGIDTYKFRVNNRGIKNRYKILFVGRLVEKKGIMYLLKAYALVCKRLPNINHGLVVAGDGPQYAEAVKFADENKLNIEFLGSVNHDEVYKLMSSARIFCLPSICAENGDREGLPTVLLEAQAIGIPVITSAHGGATEGIMDGITGFSFPEKDIEKLASLLTRLIEDDDLVEKMSTQATKFVRDKFDIIECTKSLEVLYDKLSI